MTATKTAAADGVILSNSEYHSGPGLSASQLAAWVDTCPAYWQADQGQALEPSPSMRFGTLVHTMVLEPDKVDLYYATEPRELDGERVNKRKPAHRKALEAWRSSLDDGIEVVDRADWERAYEMSIAILRDPRWVAIREDHGALVERSYSWTDEETGLLCKCRPDLYAAGIVLDLKTTRNSAAPEFGKQADNLHYALKAAFYLHGLERATGERPDGFVWLAISDRCVPEWYSLDQERLELGTRAWRKALDEIAVCTATDTWPTYSSEVGIVNLPRIAAWRRPQEEREQPPVEPEPVAPTPPAEVPQAQSASRPVTITITVNGGEVAL
jgi:hypothetical protein